tara:strand:+ start:392 stop:529 length:138 start_codon:yes stop_codon:yes gene_type:complete
VELDQPFRHSRFDLLTTNQNMKIFLFIKKKERKNNKYKNFQELAE